MLNDTKVTPNLSLVSDSFGMFPHFPHFFPSYFLFLLSSLEGDEALDPPWHPRPTETESAGRELLAGTNCLGVNKHSQSSLQQLWADFFYIKFQIVEDY